MIVKILPQILESPNIKEPFMEFFDLPNDREKSVCNIETIITEKNVPKFSEK